MYEAELKEIGLTDNEIKLYLILLEHGVLNPTKCAEKTGLHRSYVYDTVERLLDKGIVNTVIVDGKKNYQAVDPKALREQFELKLKHIDEVLPKLSALFHATKEETRIELHRGKRVYRTLIKDLVSQLKKNDIVYALGVDETILDTVEPIYLKQYFTIIKEKDVKEKVIIAKGGRKSPHPNISYKEVDKKYLGDTTTVIFQSKVYIFIWGNPYYLIIIDSNKVAQTYLKQFEMMWRNGKF